MKHRVVITGLGLCTPVGIGAETFWQNLVAGRSGIGPVTLFDARSLPVRIGGEVKRLDQERLARSFPVAANERDRKIWLGLEAASQAIQDARLENFATTSLLIGVSLETFHLDCLTAANAPGASIAGGEAESSSLIAWAKRQASFQTPLDRLAQILGGHYRFGGGLRTNCSACAAGAQAIGEAYERLSHGFPGPVLAGAADSVLNPLGLGGFGLLQILSPENDRPESACRPFDATRQGTVLAEGAAFLVLETEAHARARGARIYAEVLGYGSSLDAYRLTDPDANGRGAILSMRHALADAQLAPEQIDGVNAHGTGTLKNDVVETLALKAALGPQAYKIGVTANKSMTGHMIAASGAVEAAASALTLHTRTVPPTINLRNPDPRCDLDYVTGGARAFEGKTVLSNSFGFGGQNATLIFGRYE